MHQHDYTGIIHNCALKNHHLILFENDPIFYNKLPDAGQ